MITVTAQELRRQLSFYLDKLEKGEEVTVIRHSLIIGSLKPAHPLETPEEKSKMEHLLTDGRKISFREPSPYESPDPIKDLYLEVSKTTGVYIEPTDEDYLDRDLDNVWASYTNMGGGFIVGELDGQVVAIGGFRLNLSGRGGKGSAEVKRMRVRSDLQGKGVGGKLLGILEAKAKQQGYTTAVLDTTDKQPEACRFYEKHGYQEFERRKAELFNIIYYKKAL